MTPEAIAAILRAHINVLEHPKMTPAIEEHRRTQPHGERHFCTITGIDKAAAAIAEKLK
jgi:hypothetical protein